MRLPTVDEARDDPNLVITLDETPPAGYPVKSAPPAKPRTAAATQATPSPVDLPASGKAPPAASLEVTPRPATPKQENGEIPVDLPPAGSGNRFVLPKPDDETVVRMPRESSRTARDARAVAEMLGWAIRKYLRHPAQFFLLAAVWVLPAAILESCLCAGTVSSDQAAMPATRTTVDFTARKAELATRIQQAQARGLYDKQATAELAALTSVETALSPSPEIGSRDKDGGFRVRLAAFIEGFLVFGLALPMALAVLTLATIDQQAGLALPSFSEVWPILGARAPSLLVSLLPAALATALGYALFIVPGLVLSVLFVFVPHVVLFEKRAGTAALSRSVELLRTDARRALLAVLAFALASFLAALLAQWLLPATGSRALVFVHYLIANLLALVVFPVAAMVLARVYLDIRARTGTVAERLSRAARS